MQRTLLAWIIGFIALSASTFAADKPNGNRLTYLDEPCNPWYPHRDFPKLTTPMWVGEEGVEAVVILGIDDMRGHEKWEAYLRPILNRLKQIDGRAPVSIFTCSIDPKQPHLQQWLEEGLSLEIHTIDHPCPLLKDGDLAKAKSTVDRCIDLLNEVPNNKPVCFRMPCCDSLNTLSPRFFTEIFNKTTAKGNFLLANSSVMQVFTSADPALPRESVLDADGKEKFKKYLPADRFFANSIENYPYPYVVDRLCWEFPCVAPSDWAAQHLHKPNNPKTVEDWKAALDCTVIKQGVFCLVFHPHSWIKPEQINELIDHAVTKHGKKVKFLNFREAVERLNKNVLGGGSLSDRDTKLVDLNDDGYLDVIRNMQKSDPAIQGGAIVIGDNFKPEIRPARPKVDPSEFKLITRLWQPNSKSWGTSEWVSKGDFPQSHFAIVRNDGFPSWICVRHKWTGSDAGERQEFTQLRHFNGQAWSDSSEPIPFVHPIRCDYSESWETTFRDIDHDGRCELITIQSAGQRDKETHIGNMKVEIGRLNSAATKWEFDQPIPFRHLSTQTTFFTDSRGGSGLCHDLGVRFVDLDEDGVDDLVISNVAEYSVRLFEQSTKRWSKLVLSGQRGDKPAEQELPPIVRADGSNNGFWVHSRNLVWMNEDTAKSKDLVERRSFDELLACGNINRRAGGRQPPDDSQNANDFRNKKDVRGLTPAGSPKTEGDEDGPKSPEESLKLMQVKPGYRVELIAAEPLVRDPVAFDWGPDGKLWVAEMADYPLGVGDGEESDGEDVLPKSSPVAPRQESRRTTDSPSAADSAKKVDGRSADPHAERQGYKRGGGRVRFLEDTDGDGKYDKSTVFLDKLNFPNGVMPWRDGVLISAAPEVLFARDTNGDSKADEVKVLLTGFGEGNQQHRVNGFSWGLDNMVHCANGDSGGTIKVIGTVPRPSGSGPATTTRPLPDGRGTDVGFIGKTIDIRGRDFRWNPDTGELDPTSGQTQFGRNRDDFGNWFGNNNANPMYHFVLDDFYTRRNPHVAPPDPKKQVSINPGPSPVFPISRTLARFNDFAMANRFTSANSAMVYRDELLFAARRSDFQSEQNGLENRSTEQHVFISEPVHNLVHHEVMTADGVTFTSRRADDEQQSEFLASKDNWFRPTQIKAGPDGALYIADMYRQVIEHPQYIPPALQEKLDLRAGHDKGRIYRVVREGQPLHEVKKRDPNDVLDLTEALDHPNGWQRDLAHRLLSWKWTELRDAKSFLPSSIRADRVRQLEFESGVKLGTARPSVPDRAAVRLQVLAVLNSMGLVRERNVVEGLADEHPAVRRFAIQLCETLPGALSDRVFNQLSSMGLDADPSVRMQFAYTLGHPRLASLSNELGKLLYRERDDKYLVAAAMSSIHAKNVASIVANVFESAGKDPLPPQLASTLLGLAATLGEDQALLSLIEYVLSGAATTEAQPIMLAQVLETLDQRGTSLSQLKGIGPERLARAEQQLADRIKAARAEIAKFKAHISNLKPEDSVRVIASLPLLGRMPSDRAADAELIGSLLVPQVPATTQSAAIGALSRFNHANSATALLSGWKMLTPGLRQQVLDALLSRVAWTDRLLDQIEAKTISSAEIDAIRRQRLTGHTNPTIKARAAKLLDVATNADRQKVVAEYAAKLKDLKQPGDATRGAVVFKERQCAACHKLRDIGTQVGPDLVSLTDKSTAALLTAILDPNKAVEAKYLVYAATKTDGRVVTGMIVSETGNSIALAGLDGKPVTLLRNDIDEFIGLNKSFMPEGLETGLWFNVKEPLLTAESMADLIAFVQSSGPPPKKFDGNQPEAVTADANGTLRLLATNAEIFGTTLVFEPQFKNLGYWGSVDDLAVWSINVTNPGKYSIRLNYACDNGTAGNEVVFEVAGQSVKAKIVGTGSWENYQTAILGELNLPAGQHRLAVRAAETLKNHLMDLKELRLVPE